MTLLARRSLSLILTTVVADAALGQALELDVVGGSTPGVFSLHMSPGAYPFELGVVVPSFNRGPTPLSLFDPNDPRSLEIGTELLGAALFASFDLTLHLNIGPLTMNSVPGFQDLPIYFQGITFLGWPTIVDRISNPNVIRLGIANTFRDRSVTFQDDRAFGTVMARDDRTWMVVGGARGQLLGQLAHDTTSIYNPLDDAFTPGPIMTAPRSMHTQTLLNDGRTLFVGGVNATNDPQATCEIYDPVTDSFSAVASMSLPRMGHTTTLLPSGEVWVTGGLDAVTVVPSQTQALCDATDKTEIYDPVTDTWSPTPDLLTKRAAHFAILRPDGKVLVGGGIWGSALFGICLFPAVEASCDIYDPVTGSMVAGPSMATARSLVEPLDLGGDRWLLAGGISVISTTNPGIPTATAEIYDAVADTWTTVGSMATARGYHRGWAIGNGQYMLAGGAAGDLLTPIPLDSVEVFSTATNLFTAGPSMTIPRAAPAVFLTPQGQVHVLGGGSTNNMITNTSEFYYR